MVANTTDLITYFFPLALSICLNLLLLQQQAVNYEFKKVLNIDSYFEDPLKFDIKLRNAKSINVVAFGSFCSFGSKG